ncbi:aspartate--tRNA ligase [Pelagibacterium sediminicola]|uniref:aspartate--tRNA ligase n=1 Tax=Pelagibacterium sediminicola TaxID=2248761 RepID=UPI000E31F41D|nr:aspartate--tRNA ligase [Pelagibacterium sediminicola]
MHRYRSHTCAQLEKGDVGQTARLSGWVHRIRDHGGLLFIDLRDHYGLTQCVVDPDSPAFALAETVRAEWVIRVDGEVKARTPETTNRNLPTGEVEVFIREIEVLGKSAELPLPVFGEPDYPEDTRLRYRFIDLRRETLHANIVKRSKIIAAMREGMTEAGFGEYSTPILTASSPEGARDFLVPSRMHPGKFFALPQAPQQYKQLLMVAGFDRYFQIAPCFRDEDPRADRLPGEFYQLDLEMSFVTQEEIWDTLTPIMTSVFEQFAEGKRVTKDWPRIPYDTAMRKYGTDKPDLRNPIEMQDVTDHFRDSGFKVFANQIANDPKVEVWAIPAKNKAGAEPIGRAFCDRMNAWAQGEGQPGLGYIFFKEGAGSGPIAKNIGEERTDALRAQLGLEDGDAVFFVCGVPAKFAAFAGSARTRIGTDLDLVDLDSFELCWIVDFPFYEWDEDEKKLDFAHNPFSMPQGGLDALQNADPLTIKAYQYDAVCNGFEIASGSIRNQEPETMIAAFEKVGLSKADVEDKFGGLYRAFQYGAPPHGGAAFGIDRVVMLLCGAQNLREITPFPMNQQAEDLLMGAPSEPTARQLRELHLRVNMPAEKKG